MSFLDLPCLEKIEMAKNVFPGKKTNTSQLIMSSNTILYCSSKIDLPELTLFSCDKGCFRYNWESTISGKEEHMWLSIDLPKMSRECWLLPDDCSLKNSTQL